MIPRLLEYEDGRVKVTAEAFAIPEIKALLDKYDMKAEPYLSYVHSMTAPNSPYVNVPDNEKQDAVIYDTINTLGEFDFEDPMLEEAVKKFEYLYTSEKKRYRDALRISIDKMSTYLRTKDITEGKDGNLSEIIRIHKEGVNTLKSLDEATKMVDEELAFKMKGKSELGEY